MADDLYPIALLIDELKSDDNEVRIKSIRRLRTIAQALGTERTRTELIPFINQNTEDEDEILVIMSEQLGGFVDLVGGPAHAQCLLEPLEVLAGVEETVVREKATESICKVVSQIPNADLAVDMVARLAGGDWFTSRVSACGCFAAIYAKLTNTEKKEQLRRLFDTMARDDTPMVRRAAAAKLGEFAAVMEKSFVLAELLPLFKALAADDQDSVRLLAIENCAAIGKLMDVAENTEHILPVVRSSCDDRSWRVRFNVAKEFHALSASMGHDITTSELLPSFVNLLQDAEAEVRSAAVKSVPGYCDLVGVPAFIAEIMPVLQLLAQDTAQNVRVALSTGVMDVAAKLGAGGEGFQLISEHLMPLVLHFLRDDIPEVRLNVLQKMGALGAWLEGLSPTLLPVLMEMTQDRQWRVRKAIVGVIPLFVEMLGAQYFSDHLFDVFMASMNDSVNDVRESGTACLRDMLASTGSDWMQQNVLPRIREYYDNSTYYLQRITVMIALKNLATKNTSAMLMAEMVTLALRGARDPIPNVRFCAAQALCAMLPQVDRATVTSQIRPCLQEMQRDADLDVRHFGEVALEAVVA